MFLESPKYRIRGRLTFLRILTLLQNAPTRNQILTPENLGARKGKPIVVLKAVVSVNASTLMQPFS